MHDRHGRREHDNQRSLLCEQLLFQGPKVHWSSNVEFAGQEIPLLSNHTFPSPL